MQEQQAAGLPGVLAKAVEKTNRIMAEDLLRNAVADEDILTQLKMDLVRSRMDNKKNQRACNSALRNYAMYGPEYIRATTLSNRQVAELTSSQLLAALHDVLGTRPKILYYGPASADEVRKLEAK